MKNKIDIKCTVNPVWKRLFARILDVFFIYTIVIVCDNFFLKIQYPYAAYLFVYFILVALLNGKTLGKYCLHLTSAGSGLNSIFQRSFREIALLIFFPVIIIQMFFGFRGLHEKITKIFVITSHKTLSL